MIKKILNLLIPFILLSCSANTNSDFWNKDFKNEKMKENQKVLFKEKQNNLSKTNTNVKILLKENYNLDSFVNNLTNNNKITNYDGKLQKNNNFSFNKIKNYKFFLPEILVTKNKNFIYFDGNGNIFKLNSDLKIIWKSNIYKKKEKKLDPIIRFSQHKNTLIAVDSLANYFALNMKNGKLLWKFTNISPFNSQVKVYKDKMYVVDLEDTLRCYSVLDGKSLWNYKSETSFIKSTKSSSLVIKDNKIIFINSLGDVNALTLDDGNLIWQTPTQNNPVFEESFSIIYSDIVSDEKSIYFSNNRNQIFSLNIKNGSVNWINRINSSIRPTIINKLLFTISEDGFLVVINKFNGQIIRATNFGESDKLFAKKNSKINGFVIAKNNIMLSLNGSLLKINIEYGKIEDIIKLSKNNISRPVVSKRELVIVTEKKIKTFN